MKVSELIEILQRDYRPDESVAYSLWTAEDVRSVLAEIGKPLDEATIGRILEELHDSQDASIGMNWQVLEQMCRWYIRGQEGGAA